MELRRLPLMLAALVASHPGPALGEDLDAPDPDKVPPSKGYQYDHEHFSIRFGGGVLIDYNRFDQDDESEEQLDWDPEIGIRDLRVIASGRTPWPVLTYTVG